MVFNLYHNAPVIQIDEYAPHTNPTIKVKVNSFIDDTPNINNANTITNVVIDVINDLEKV